MHTGKAFDTREPEAEELIGPSFRFENMKGKHLMADYYQIDFGMIGGVLWLRTGL